MGALRARVVREMELRELSPSTQTLYLATLTDLAKHLRIVAPEHSVRDRGVGGSNPLAPTNFTRSILD